MITQPNANELIQTQGEERRERLTHLAALLPLVTAGFYLFGISYHQGYLSELGIEETLFPLTIDRTLFEGFIAAFTMGMPGLLFALLAAETIFVVSEMLVLFSSLRFVQEKVSAIRRVFNVSKKDDAPKERLHSFSDFSLRMLVILAMVSITLGGVMLLAYLSDKSGRKVADRFKEKYSQNAYSPKTINFNSGGNPVVGILIECNASYCAYWSNGKAITIAMSQCRKLLASNLKANNNQRVQAHNTFESTVPRVT